MPSIGSMRERWTSATRSIGAGTLVDVWRTRRAWHRIFAGTLASCETNAFFAYNLSNTREVTLTKVRWYNALSEALINNPLDNSCPVGCGPCSTHTSCWPCEGTQRHCFMCSHPTNYTCRCGRPMCNIVTRKKANGQKDDPRPCHAEHQEAVADQLPDHIGPHRG